MNRWDYNKLINGIRIVTILSILLITVLHIAFNNMNSSAIDSILWGVLILLILQGITIDSIIKKMKTNS